MLDRSKTIALDYTAKRLGVPYEWLYKLIKFETAGTFSPTIKNRWSTARGLIQFINDTARELGYDSSLDLVNSNPTFEEQVKGPVYEYLKKYAPFNSKANFYLSVLLPAYRFKSLNTELSPQIKKVNPGLDTLGDYVRKVDGVSLSDGIISKGLAPLFLLGAAGLAGYIFIMKPEWASTWFKV